MCQYVPPGGSTVCTNECFIYYENFDDQDIDQPETGEVEIRRYGWQDTTRYNLTTAGWGEYGYAFQASPNVDASFVWFLGDTTWIDDDDLYVEFDVRFNAYVANAPESLGVASIVWNGGDSYLKMALESATTVSYEIKLKNATGVEGSFYTTTSQVLGNWVNYKIYICFRTGVIKVWANNLYEIHEVFGGDAFTNTRFMYIMILGFDRGTASTFQRELDEVEIWTCPPRVPCTTDEQCDDELYCNGEESCVDGMCEEGIPIDCNDDTDCTIDTCDEEEDECDNEQDNELCDDENDCTTDICTLEGCTNECNAETPIDVCCLDSACAEAELCEGSAELIAFESFDDQEVDPPFGVERWRPHEFLSPESGMYTYLTGYGDEGYCLAGNETQIQQTDGTLTCTLDVDCLDENNNTDEYCYRRPCTEDTDCKEDYENYGTCGDDDKCEIGKCYIWSNNPYNAPFITYYQDAVRDLNKWETDHLFFCYDLKFDIPSYLEWFTDKISMMVVDFTPPSADIVGNYFALMMSSYDAPVVGGKRHYLVKAKGEEGITAIQDTFTSDIAIENGEWHTICGYLNLKEYGLGSGHNMVRFWIDNVPVWSEDIIPSIFHRDLHYIYLPGPDYAPSGVFRWMIDNVSIWDNLPAYGVNCDEHSDCTDGDVCTDNYCIRGECYTVNNNALCDDANGCTMNDTCCDGVCAGETLDADGDGQSPSWCDGDDCDDSDPLIYTGATERCNGIDDDCDGTIPDNENDTDADTYRVCDDDCDDTDVSVHPGATEGPLGNPTCTDEKDNDCDGLTDIQEVSCRECTSWSDCVDGNECTYDTCSNWLCSNPNNTSPCDDGDPCTIGDTCAGGVCVPGPTTDVDGDGYAPIACAGTDCNDANAAINPLAMEGPAGDATCSDSIDNNCNSLTDGSDPGCQTFPISGQIIIVN